jgi:hypothetical protein
MGVTIEIGYVFFWIRIMSRDGLCKGSLVIVKGGKFLDCLNDMSSGN